MIKKYKQKATLRIYVYVTHMLNSKKDFEFNSLCWHISIAKQKYCGINNNISKKQYTKDCTIDRLNNSTPIRDQLRRFTLRISSLILNQSM